MIWTNSVTSTGQNKRLRTMENFYLYPLPNGRC